MSHSNPFSFWSIIAALLFGLSGSYAADDTPAPLEKAASGIPAIPASFGATGPRVSVAQYMGGDVRYRNYPYGLPTLLSEMAKVSTVRIDPEPHVISSFEDERIFDYPVIYVNFADRKDWTFSPLEIQNLKTYLERGGFIYVDAGINAEFLREKSSHGQHHSFAEWQASPKLAEAFATVFPGRTFRPLPRSHKLYQTFYKGLPDPSGLPDTVRDFVVNEKWPQGTYSAVGLEVNGRIAVLATPIIAMGWGKDHTGNWRTQIRFRVRDGAANLADYLSSAAYSGQRFETAREDGRKDVIYCQSATMPSWAQEPNGKWRIFNYHGSREISEYAHVFYTRLGINIFIYALTH